MLYVVTMVCDCPLAVVQARLGYAHDFYGVLGGTTGSASVGTWILCTSDSAEWWYGHLNSLAKPDGSLLVARLSEDDYRGYMQTRFWDWLRSHVACA